MPRDPGRTFMAAGAASAPHDPTAARKPRRDGQLPCLSPATRKRADRSDVACIAGPCRQPDIIVYRVDIRPGLCGLPPAATRPEADRIAIC